MTLLIAAGNLLMFLRAIHIRDVFFSVNYALQLVLWMIIAGLSIQYGIRRH
jgi:hypothetical protein